jgi:hypothetical protein
VNEAYDPLAFLLDLDILAAGVDTAAAGTDADAGAAEDADDVPVAASCRRHPDDHSLKLLER